MSNDKLSVCLLGATGFLGSAIAKELDSRNISWTGIAKDASDDSRVKALMLSDRDEVISLFKNADIIINALGSAKPKDFEDNPQATVNTVWENAVLLTDLMRQAGGAKLVHISSAGTVYGEYKTAPHKEDADLLPISWYGKAKVIEELYLEKACVSNQFPYLCLRVTNPYGNEKKTTHGFIDVLIHSVLEGNPFSFYEDCNPIRDFIYADDMAFSVVELIDKGCNGIVNLGSGQECSLEELANYVSSKFSGNTFIKRQHEKPSYDVLINKVNINKLESFNAKRASMDVYKYIDYRLNLS